MAKRQSVIIEHRTTGEQYGVTVGDFKKHYAEQGFKIVSNEDGSPYSEPKAPEPVKDANKPANA